jgi:tRNA (guanine37-N1)-methyltransferase
MIQFDILTLFPGMFTSPLQESILNKARQKGLVRITVHDLRDFTGDKHRTADDAPYGGGAGMVMKVEPIVRALEQVKTPAATARSVLLSPQGTLFNQEAAQRLSACGQIVLVCGRYEGVDERVTGYVDEELSIGDYVLSGGEIAAMVIVDAVARLVPGVVGDRESVLEDSFSGSVLKYPQYTRPASFRGSEVPEVLISGDHAKIRQWRRAEALKKTLQRRPDLLEKAPLTQQEKNCLHMLQQSKKWS